MSSSKSARHSASFSGTPEIGYSPNGEHVCASCRSHIRQGQLRFTKNSELGSNGWSHFLCLLEAKPRAPDQFVLSGVENSWYTRYRERPEFCTGYSSLRRPDKILFNQSLQQIDSAAIRLKQKEEDELSSVSVPLGNRSHMQTTSQSSAQSIVEPFVYAVDRAKLQAGQSSSLQYDSNSRAAPGVEHFNVNAYDWLKDLVPSKVTPGTVNRRPELSNDRRAKHATNLEAPPSDGISSRGLARLDSGAITSSRRVIDNSTQKAQSNHDFETTSEVPETRRSQPSTADHSDPDDLARLRQPTQTDSVHVDPPRVDESQAVIDHEAKHPYCVKVIKRRARCVRCTPPGHIGHPTSTDTVGVCLPGQLVLATWNGRHRFWHVGCLSQDDLTSIRDNWRAMGKDVPIHRFIADFDTLDPDDQQKLFTSIKKRRNQFAESSIIDTRSDRTTLKRKADRDSTSLPDPRRNKDVNLAAAVSTKSLRSSTANKAQVNVVALSDSVFDPAVDLSDHRVNFCEDEDNLWLLVWDHAASTESSLYYLGKVSNCWKKLPTLKQKVGKWGNLMSPGFTVKQSIPYMQKVVLSTFKSIGGRSYMLVYGERSPGNYDWIYIDLSSGIWWKQNPEKDIPPRYPKGNVVLHNSQLMLWSGGIVHASTKDSHKGGLACFDIPSQSWLAQDVPLSPAFENHLSSCTARASRSEVAINCLGILQNHLFVLPYNTQPSKGICFDRVLYRCLATEDDEKEPLGPEESQRLIDTSSGDVPKFMTSARLHVLDDSTLVIIGHSSGNGAVPPGVNNQAGFVQLSEKLRIWRCRFTKPVTAIADDEALIIRGHWQEIKCSQYLPDMFDIHVGFVHEGKLSVLGHTKVSNASDTTPNKRSINMRVNLDICSIADTSGDL